MSILIKGMKMPKNCYCCPFLTQVDYLNKDDEVDIMSKCKRTGKFTWESVNGYLPNCPLIPVPPHGDLIDRDALMLRINIHGTNKFGMLDEDIRQFVNAAPTVIPADDKDTDAPNKEEGET